MNTNEIINSDFIDSAEDYLYLIEKNYPYKPSLKLISDKYRLNKIQRSVLMRGITDKQTALNRKNKIITNEKDLINKNLVIDFYNVIATISGYLNGSFLFISLDGFLRDAQESHGGISKSNNIDKSLDLLFNYLIKIKSKYIKFFLDSPISNSIKTADKINQLININNLPGNAEVVKSADYFIVNSNYDIISTSDSVIIDKKNKIFDIAFHVLKNFYNPDFVKLSP